MHHLRFFGIICLALMTVPAMAQQNGQRPVDPFEHLLRRMDEQMSKGLFPADSAQQRGGDFYISPDSSLFFFKMDTLFQGGGLDFFQTDPFGNSIPQGFSDLQQLFERFFQGLDPNQLGPGSAPADDGNAPPDLLPEERLRQEEGSEPSAPAPPAPARKRSTIRI